nr:hypothetical protein [Tanacetum cinerariifolium]
MINNQVDDLSSHTTRYTYPTLTQKGRIDDVSAAAIKDVNVVEPTVFDDEEVTITMAQTLIKMKAKKQDFLMSKWLKGMTYDKVRPIFKREYSKVQTLFKPDKNVEEPQKKRVAEETLLQDSFKKLKVVEVSSSESTQDIPTNDPKEISEEDVQNMLEIVPVNEFKAEALHVKYPLIDWEIHSEGSRSYWKIIRAGGIT